MRRSTFYDEDLSELVDLSGHGTWVNASICEIIQDLVVALSTETGSEGHEERFAALGAVQKTDKHQARSRGPQSKRGNSLSRCLKLPRKNLVIRCPTVPNVRAGSTFLFWATTNLNGLQVCLGGCRPWKHQSPPSQKQPSAGQQWPSKFRRLKPREDFLGHH